MSSKILPSTTAIKTIAKAIATQFITIGLLVGCNSKDEISKALNNQKLSGTWEFKNQDGTKNGAAIFEAKTDLDGDVYILSNDMSSGKTAIAGKYKVNANTNPAQLDLTFGDLTTQTIYEIGNDGQLKIANALPEQPRPTSIENSQPQHLTKVTDSTTIASDVKILRSPDLIASSSLIREVESKSNIRAIMQSQQQIFQEKGQFTSDINQFLLTKPLNSEFYNYKITVLTDAPSGLLVQNSAIPLKDGLKAYTGIVYAIASNESNSRTTKSIICESNISTKAIPTRPKNQEEGGYSCPDAYTAINP
jgi:uncharacterized protein (TIGR03067 family)